MLLFSLKLNGTSSKIIKNMIDFMEINGDAANLNNVLLFLFFSFFFWEHTNDESCNKKYLLHPYPQILD